jgi:hypothetical protein
MEKLLSLNELEEMEKEGLLDDFLAPRYEHLKREKAKKEMVVNEFQERFQASHNNPGRRYWTGNEPAREIAGNEKPYIVNGYCIQFQNILPEITTCQNSNHQCNNLFFQYIENEFFLQFPLLQNWMY